MGCCLEEPQPVLFCIDKTILVDISEHQESTVNSNVIFVWLVCVVCICFCGQCLGRRYTAIGYITGIFTFTNETA